jgi:dihydropteroate synthase
MMLQMRDRQLDLSQPRVMGVLNVTPDSFSDGGRYLGADAALAHARALVAQGAAIIDVGGESTRPGAAAVSSAEELRRVLPAIEAIAATLDVAISIDTSKPAVMSAACRAGAHMINDVTALRTRGALQVAGDSGAALCLMHMQGRPRSMQKAPAYADVVAEVHAFLGERALACAEAGIVRERLVVDPGIGFGKTLAHNLALLGALDRFEALGVPVMVGVSRKSMFGKLLGAQVDQRLPASLAAAALAVWQGAAIVRAHDVAETVHALRVAQAIKAARGTI